MITAIQYQQTKVKKKKKIAATEIRFQLSSKIAFNQIRHFLRWLCALAITVIRNWGRQDVRAGSNGGERRYRKRRDKKSFEF